MAHRPDSRPPSQPPRPRRFWGWGYEDTTADPLRLSLAESALPSLLGAPLRAPGAAPRIDEIELSAPRIAPPASLARLVTDDPTERAGHTYGKSYRDLVRALARDYAVAPDLVAYPHTEDDVGDLLDWCDRAGIAVLPYGGGSSVCGGVEPAVGDTYTGTLSLDLGRLARVLEVDFRSRSARIQAGVLGPALEDQLRPHGLTLRHYPQSFEVSSLGGWIATRAGGHFATLVTHIDELVQGLRVVTPSGVIETRRLPGDGAGPSPERLYLGSEGAFGVITEAWMRLFERPRFRASFAATFASFGAGLEGVRLLAQSGLHPANCRLLDPTEALLNGAGTGERAPLLVAFESADHPVSVAAARAAALCRDAGGEVPEGAVREAEGAGEREGAAGAWREAFVRAPYLRDELARRGLLVETYETAATWDQVAALHGAVMAAARRAAAVGGATPIVTCRITHAYPDGVAPYFTVLAPAPPGAELRHAGEVKAAITEAILAHGGTVTHHHAVGRDVRPFYEHQVPALHLRALAAVKAELDPRHVLNPGVLLPAPRRRGG
ncbi:MAG: FAD-binding oxidoreductase [Polyangiaceae bacterium]|nr:FAD-binding oxidoreductase [Polyangiaceae bacterium]